MYMNQINPYIVYTHKSSFERSIDLTARVVGSEMNSKRNVVGRVVMLLCILTVSCLVSTAIAAPRQSSSTHDTTTTTTTTNPNYTIINLQSFVRSSSAGDHTRALSKAWKKACATHNPVLVVPAGKTYRARQLTFSGPCVSDNITFQIHGTIQASNNMADYEKDRQHWIMFKNIDSLIVTGGGTIDGNGAIWWKNSCKINKSRPCRRAPTAVTFYGSDNLVVDSIRVKRAQQMHMVVQDCSNVRLSRVAISSPGDSPNTDGIHVTSSTSVVIQKSRIATGDDCISIVSGSRNVRATDITCGPGHGISIGSLGKDGEKARVSNIHVNGAILKGTSNGVRIKTWQGGSGYAKNIVFKNVKMHNVSNPIIIDQNYCDQNTPCTKKESAVQVKSVTYSNIQGTSSTEEAIKMECSEVQPCKGILLNNVNLKQNHGRKANATCNNISPTKNGIVVPSC